MFTQVRAQQNTCLTDYTKSRMLEEVRPELVPSELGSQLSSGDEGTSKDLQGRDFKITGMLQDMSIKNSRDFVAQRSPFISSP